MIGIVTPRSPRIHLPSKEEVFVGYDIHIFYTSPATFLKPFEGVKADLFSLQMWFLKGMNENHELCAVRAGDSQ